MDTFDEIVGQQAAKDKLSFFLSGYKQTQILDPILFVAPKGCGKSLFSRSLAKKLTRSDGSSHKDFIEINCSVIENLGHFFDSVVFPYVVNGDVTLFLDEASEIPHDLTMALLTILNPNPQNTNDFVYQNNTISFDLKKTSWIIATSEAQKVFPPLVDRLERIDLEEYNLEELGLIIQKGFSQIKFDKKTLIDIASTLRGNPRSAQKTTNKIKQYSEWNKIQVFGQNEWQDFKKRLHIQPLGLSPLEIQILKILEQNGETSLTSLSAKTGMSKESLQKDVELFLLKNSLIEIRTRGRCLTNNGFSYLKKLKSK